MVSGRYRNGYNNNSQFRIKPFAVTARIIIYQWLSTNKLSEKHLNLNDKKNDSFSEYTLTILGDFSIL